MGIMGAPKNWPNIVFVAKDICAMVSHTVRWRNIGYYPSYIGNQNMLHQPGEISIIHDSHCDTMTVAVIVTHIVLSTV